MRRLISAACLHVAMTQHQKRVGTTLSEVLISLLVMSVGVVSLATLFPISVLRSVQATHLTNATNLRYNVEAMLSIRPELYSIGTPWVALKTYNSGDLVIPTELASLKMPPVVFQCMAATGQSGMQEPAWNLTNGGTTPSDGTQDGSVTWVTYRLQNYVIDPLGKWNVESAYRATATNGDFFGNNGVGPRQVQLATGAYNVRAFQGLGAGSLLQAADAATLPDSWVVQAESNSITTSASSCTLNDMQVDISQSLPIDTTFPQSRLVLFDATGKYSAIRPITACSSLTGSQITVAWSTIAGGLPNNFTPVSARVESKEQRYSWLLSVRRGFSGTSFMDVVVFFRRTYSAKEEQVYPATFTAQIDTGYDGTPGTPDNPVLGWPGSDDAPRNWVVVQYDDATGDKPYLKKGGFVTDADGLRWYRIIDIVEGDAFSGYTPDAVMKKAGLKTQSVVATSSITADLPYASFTSPRAIFLRIENQILQSGPQPSGGQPTGAAMLMKGIVDVYPIRTHLTWED